MESLKNSCPIPTGILLVVGGHENKDADSANSDNDYHPREILETFIKLTGKNDVLIEVITTASAEGEDSFKDYLKVFKELGAKQVGHIHHDKRGDVLNDIDVLNRVKHADAIFFSGGDQLKLTSVYGGTDVLCEIKQRYIYENLVLGGTSAGAMAMSTPMIFAGNKTVQQIAGEVRVTTGLEFLKDVCIDTHFVDRGRFVRMAQVIATNPTCIGIGIEENTAIIVRNGNQTEVIGDGVVIVIEGFRITDSNIVDFGEDKCIQISDLTVKILSKGNGYLIPSINPPHL